MVADPKDKSLEARINRVLEKLEGFRRRKPRRCQEEHHGFRLGPPLQEVQINSFEQSAGVRLPEAYRQFLILAGDGGAGPPYGLYPLERWSKQVLWAENHHGAGYLAKPCPICPGMPQGVGGSDAGQDIWDDLCAGTLTISDAGCSFFSLLIVSGEYRGRVVHVDYEQNGGPYMTRDVDFIAWYERWLDAVLLDWDVSGFGPGLPGDMARMLEILKDGRSSNEDLVEALHTIRSAPAFIEGMDEEVVALLRSPSPAVRYVAVCAVEKHRPQGSAADLKNLLMDGDHDIRYASVFALRSLRPEGWIESLRPMLQDTEHGVVFATLCGLLDAKALRREDVRPLIESDKAENRSSGLFAWGKSGFSIQGETWVEARMHDADSKVRSEFVQAMRLIEPPNLGQILSTMKERHPADPCFPKPVGPFNIIGRLNSFNKACERIGPSLISRVKKRLLGRK